VSSKTSRSGQTIAHGDGLMLLLTERQAAVGLLAYRVGDINDLIESKHLCLYVRGRCCARHWREVPKFRNEDESRSLI
jgi:hypothetical protein